MCSEAFLDCNPVLVYRVTAVTEFIEDSQYITDRRDIQLKSKYKFLVEVLRLFAGRNRSFCSKV